MSELLDVYDLDGKFIKTQDRKEFYSENVKEYQEKGSISRKVKTVRILILNHEGRIYLQKRSLSKSDNPGLYDKTVGGHIAAGESAKVAVVRECAEELGFPAVILSEEEFRSAINSTDLSVVSILTMVSEEKDFVSTRVLQDTEIHQPLHNYFYIGYYDGAIRFKDGESTGIETFSLSELENELAVNPTKFTNDLRFMIDKFRSKLIAL